MNDYVGFGVETRITDKGIETIFTIDNKKYPAKKLTNILNNIEPQIKEIEEKIDEIDEKYRDEIKHIISVYRETNDPVNKLRLVHRLVQIGVNVINIVNNIIDIKNKLGL